MKHQFHAMCFLIWMMLISCVTASFTSHIMNAYKTVLLQFQWHEVLTNSLKSNFYVKNSWNSFYTASFGRLFWNSVSVFIRHFISFNWAEYILATDTHWYSFVLMVADLLPLFLCLATQSCHIFTRGQFS